MKVEAMASYLNDHLAGAEGAVSTLEDLIERQDNDAARAFFTQLHDEIGKDRDLLQNLLEGLGYEESGFKQVIGNLTAGVGHLKLWSNGLKEGEFGLFEALEMLAIGIQGKRLLWRALATVAVKYPGWSGTDFLVLEGRARDQRNAVEKWRLKTAALALVPED